MKKIALTLGVLATAAAATASAATYYRTTESWPTPVVDGSQECWNPRAGHFEQVRPGEYQGDLDFNRCRTVGYSSGYTYEPRYESRYYYDNRRDDRRYYRESRQECWNPGARHFEEVRPGETQNDLDYSRCRVYR
jgi:hypothetical protein